MPNLWNFFQRSWPRSSIVVPFLPTKNPGEHGIGFSSVSVGDSFGSVASRESSFLDVSRKVRNTSDNQNVSIDWFGQIKV